ncbi:site-specific DNA-methyltransferase [Curvibacter sp. RS43]|uniref:site-specific DNA-methyltransferase n=1 Tax=Curvibacter microcysteis TaxID=3026419 RepID=UPI00235E75DF|nr:site-specific DNA-methyltransferase [Curvibacter sp. RS43]MDD0810457.1 site-specific DNA-methyltransferase [Curvibacter sp. RS43]
MATKKNTPLSVETLKHEDATRKNIPTAEYQSVMKKEQQSPVRVAYPREREGRNRDLDPQLVWRGKDEQDWSDLVVHAPPLYIQEKVHPKVLIDDLKRQTERAQGTDAAQVDMFADFNGLPNEDAKTEFYAHDAHWANRMILGDSLAVMASLAEREGLRGKVQCIYFDPPYGIKFNSNFQWSTTSRDVKDGNASHITREPEQVKAFRDTWRDGIHSYLTYLRDRLTVARDLLADSGSIFVQIGEENVHRVRAILDEVFGDANFVSQINFKTTGGAGSPTGGTDTLASVNNFILWFAKDAARVKYRQPYRIKGEMSGGGAAYNKLDFFDTKARRAATDEERTDIPRGARLFRWDNLTSQSSGGPQFFDVVFEGKTIPVGKSGWKTTVTGMTRLQRAQRIGLAGKTLSYVRYVEDFAVYPLNNSWEDTVTAGFASDKLYVVQTNPKVIERCILMATDPGDLVLDPTCGSGTAAYVAEQWGRRWITIDTSRVALALARARIMGARYPYYLLADSREGQLKEAEVTRSAPSSAPVRCNVRQGFVYERVPHITLKSIANNSEIDVIYEQYQAQLVPLLDQLNAALKKNWREHDVPRETDSNWPAATQKLHIDWWTERIARQRAVDASIAARAEFEFIYDRPYEDKKKVRVAGPFTVESLSPHRVLGVDENDELIDPNDPKVAEQQAEYNAARSFVQIILENLKTAGVQQAHKEDKIVFTSLVAWPGDLVCGEGLYEDGTGEKRAAIFIGPEFGTVSRPDLVSAAREAGDAGFDVLIACAFNYDAHSSEFEKLGRIPVLKARMNADLHMAEDLKNTGKGNLFVIFGEPDIDILEVAEGQVCVKVNGVDVFHPNTGEVRSDGADGIACWFIDTDYNEESFFVRHAYFLGANDPYKSLKTTLKAEINEEAWATLNSDTSRPFDKPKSGRIAVKVINHLGDEVMKVFKVS